MVDEANLEKFPSEIPAGWEKARWPRRSAVEFIDENGGGAGVRLRKRQQKNYAGEKVR